MRCRKLYTACINKSLMQNKKGLLSVFIMFNTLVHSVIIQIAHINYGKNRQNQLIGIFLYSFCRAFHGASFEKRNSDFIIVLSRDMSEVSNVAKLLPHPLYDIETFSRANSNILKTTGHLHLSFSEDYIVIVPMSFWQLIRSFYLQLSKDYLRSSVTTNGRHLSTLNGTSTVICRCCL